MFLSLLLLSLPVVIWGGQWVEMPAEYDYTYGYNYGIGLADQSFVRGKIKGCHSMEVYLRADDDTIFFQLYYSSSYTAILDNGDYKVWKFDFTLSCSSYTEVWFMWSGTVQSMGTGLVPGTNVYLTTDIGRVVIPKYLRVATKEDGLFGTWQWLIDEPPSFVKPDPKGNTLLSIPEDTAQYSAIFVVSTTDPESDDVTSTTSDQTSTLFQLYSNYLFTMNTLDYETANTYIVTIEASDGVNTVKNSLTIHITNVIDVTPVVTVYPVSIQEELPVGTDIGRAFSYVDDEEDDSWTIALSGTNSDFFNVDATTGVITIAKRIDMDAGAPDLSSVTVTVTDSAGLNDQETLDITILDINDNAPYFDKTMYTASIDEGNTNGIIVGSVVVKDDDAVNHGVVPSVLSQNGDTTSIDYEFSGNDLTIRVNIDYEAEASVNHQHVLILGLEDRPDAGDLFVTSAIFVITINPINEHAPVWDGGGSYTASVPEDTAETTLVKTISATDADMGDDGAVVYSIESVTPSTSVFTVDSVTGEVRVGGHLDADASTGGIASYTLNIRASDKGPTPKYVDGVLAVTVTGTNDQTPYFDQSSLSVTVAEDATLDTDILSIVVKDDDGDTVTLSVQSGADGHFDTNGHALRYIKAVDYETKPRYTVVVKATDGVHNAYIAVDVAVSDVKDEAPIITQAFTSTMAEGQAIGSAVVSGLIASDSDKADTLTYTVSGTDAAFVNIDSATGELTLAQTVDREAGKTSLDLTLTVTDTVGKTTSKSFTVGVEDINDNPPVFSPNIYKVEVTENTAAGVSVADLTCSDVDLGKNAQFSMTVVDVTGRFKMSGTQLQTDSTPLDFESLTSCDHTVMVLVTAVDTPDQGEPRTGTAVIKVTVKPENEHDPVWSSPLPDGTAYTLSESSPKGTAVVTLTATDADGSPDGDVVYSIVSVVGDSTTPPSDLFSIGTTTGKLVVGGILDSDDETGGDSTYTITVRASDQGTSPKSADGTVVVKLTDANDQAPVFSKLSYTADISEADTNVVVTTVQATDGDETATLTYDIASGPTGLFQMDGSDVKVTGSLDYETSTYHILVISVSDGKHTTYAPLRVNVKDASDQAPSISVFTTYVSEEQALETGVLGGYLLTDLDISDTLTYTIQGDDSGYVSVNASTGALVLVQNINKESGKDNLKLTVSVTDKGGQTATKDLTISVLDINDNVPVFTPSEYTAEMVENSPADQTLVTLTCSDDDSGNNAVYDFSVASGGSGNFKMSGNHLVTDATPVDYESLSASGYIATIVVIAVDTPDQGNAQTGTAIVKVTVKPENEGTPTWVSPALDGNNFFPGVTVGESQSPGSLIMTVSADDADGGDDGEVVYSIVSVTGDDSGVLATGKFSMDASSGQLLVAGELDADSGTGGESSYTVTLRASDQGASPRSVDAKVVVTLTNQNDNPPVFDQDIYTVEVSEAETAGHVAATLVTTDFDGGTVTMSVASGGEGLFECDGNNVKIKSKLDYETSTFHVLIIRADDSVYTTDVVVQVKVKDTIDETPIITLTGSATMSEEQALRTGICGDILVMDPDAGDVLAYTIGGTDSSYVTIDGATGDLTLAKHVDRDAPSNKKELQLTLTATDQAGLAASKDFTISVQDINDLPPTFGSLSYSVEVTENSAEGLSLLDLDCSDGDVEDNAKFVISIQNDDGYPGVFKIVGKQLQSGPTPADYDSLQSSAFTYNLLIIAVDQPSYGSALTGTTEVRIKVKPENDIEPAWTSPTPDGSGVFQPVDVSEREAKGFVIQTFVAADGDLGPDGEINYSVQGITAGSGATVTGLIEIDSLTGELYITQQLDADSKTGGETKYTVAIRASDKGTTPKYKDGTIAINVVNVNDNKPLFDQTDYTVDVSESSAIDDVVISFNVEDYDADAITLSIFDGRTDVFHCVGKDVKLSKEVDYETETTFLLVIQATDGVHNSYVPLQVNVVNVIDETPIITILSVPSMADGQAVGTTVNGGYKITDHDDGDEMTYVLSGADKSYLTIDPTNGQLTVADLVNHEDGVSSLSLILTVTDKAGLKAEKGFSILVLDVNDVHPLFNPSVYFVEVSENSGAGVSLLDVTVSDQDSGSGSSLSVSILSGDDDPAKFAVVGLQLQTTAVSVDYDSLDSAEYTLVVTAVDQPTHGESKSGTAVVHVTVLSQNEFAPTWTSPTSDTNGKFVDDITVPEDTHAGNVVVTVVADDQDKGKDGLIAYRILTVTKSTGETVDGLFLINKNSGAVYVSGDLDFDVKTGGIDSYTMVVRASDHGASPKHVDGEVVLKLTNVNDNPPVFNQTHYTIEVPEDTVVGTAIFTFITADYDGDTVTLSILSGDTSFFEISGLDLKLKDTLDFEKVQLKSLVVRASDGVHDTDVRVRIQVTDVIDETPMITIQYTSWMAEEQTMGTPVEGGLLITDMDKDDELLHKLSGADSSLLDIDPGTGQLYVAAHIDREGTNAKTQLDLTLTVTDKAGLTATKSFTVDVKDINDLAPSFQESKYEIEVSENTAADSTLLTLTCSDEDEGKNAEFDVSIKTGDDTTPKFKVTGLDLLSNAALLDFESVSTYTLVLEAVDRAKDWPAKTGTTLVNVKVLAVNEFAPVWAAPSSDGSGTFDPLTLEEDAAPGHVVTTFSATDDDRSDDGLVTYSLVSVTGDADAGSKFSVNEETGDLYVAAGLDFDTDTGGVSNYVLEVRVTDRGATAKSTDGTITVNLNNVNDNPPFFEHDKYEVDVPEDSAIGHTVVTFSTGDADQDSVVLSIVSGRGDLFQIDGHDVITKTKLDFEGDTYYVLSIMASDSKFQTEVSLQVNIVDVVDEYPLIKFHEWSSVAEEQAIGTGASGGYVVTDPDAKDVLTFALSGANKDYFSIDPKNGHLTVAKQIDREALTSLFLTLTVTDKSGLVSTADFNITVEDINDNTPVFSTAYTEINVTENTAAGASLIDFQVTDADEGNNAVFAVSVGPGDDTNKFTVSGNQLQTADTIDYESLVASDYMYLLVVTATDTPDQGDAKTGSTVVKVTVLPENEHTPVWKTPASDGAGKFNTVTTAEDLSPGSVVITFSAADEDHGADGAITYSIVDIVGDSGSNFPNLLSISPTTGELKVSEELDFDSATGGESIYSVTVMAADGGSPQKSVTGTIIVQLSNTNDNSPIFTAQSCVLTVSEDTAVDTVLRTFTLEDHDNSAMTLSVMSNNGDLFAVHGQELLLKNKLDFEKEESHVIVILATDVVHNTTLSLQVKVTDVLDEPPVISFPRLSFMSEHQVPNTDVEGGFVVIDSDAGDSVTYALTGTDSHYFSIDSATGQLLVAKDLDREGTSGVTLLTGLTLTVTDKSSLTASANFNVTIIDINDQAPTFGAATYTVDVLENTVAGTNILQLDCQDDDAGKNAEFQLSIVSGDDTDTKFAFDQVTLITGANALDYESMASSGYMYFLLINAIDTPDVGEPRTGTTVVQVNILPENEHTPSWTAGSGAFGPVDLSEDSERGTTVGVFGATDDDHGVDGVVSYSIVSVQGASGGTVADVFTINEATGELLVGADLDADSDTGGESSYVVTLRATDGGSSPLSIDGTVTVNLLNANDNPPSFEFSEYQASVNEDVSAGHVVQVLTTTDADGDAVTLKIITGSTDLFECIGNEVRVKTNLNYEEDTYHALTIEASDGTLTSHVSLLVNVNDVLDEPPVITVVGTGSMSEGQSAGTAVKGPYTATDPDKDDQLTFALTGTDANYLTIDTSTGDLTVNEVVDREGTNAKTSLDLVLGVTDSTGNSAQEAFTITVVDINDSPPKCSPPVFETEVTENTAADQLILDLNCVDPDDGNNSVFSITIGSGDDATTPRFSMVGKELRTSANSIDYETEQLFTLFVEAVDTPDQGQAMTGTAVVKVTVLPENEFSPVWVSPVPDGSSAFNDVTVDETEPPGFIVATLSASDEDKGVDGDVMYEITSVKTDTNVDAPEVFVIGKDLGDLRVKNQLDLDSGIVYYVISLRAFDGNATPKDITATMRVLINDGNDQPPSFSASEYSTDVDENVAVDTAIFTLTVTDPDGDSVTLSVVGGGSDLFQCVGHELTVIKGLDYETNRYHSLTIRATDGLFSVDVSLVVNVNDISDQTPVIELVNTNIEEEMPIDSIVGNVIKVTDTDAADTFTYSLSGPNADYFTINGTTGTLKIQKRIDREDGMTTLDQITVTVVDSGGLSTSADLSFNVEDINDNPPLFSKPGYLTSVLESGDSSTSILELTVTDADTGVNADYVISITKGDDAANPIFSVTGTTLLVDASVLDYEILSTQNYRYELTLAATNTPDQGPSLTGITTVVAVVFPVNEFDPVWSSPVPDSEGEFPPVTVPETIPVGTTVANYTADDQDAGRDGAVSYEVTSVTGSNGAKLFDNFTMMTVDGMGNLVTSGHLDFDKISGGVDYYVIEFMAFDAGAQRRSVTATVTVSLQAEDDPIIYPPAEPIDYSGEKWAMGAGIAATSLIMAGTGIYFAVQMLQNLKNGAVGNLQPGNNFERPQSSDDVFNFDGERQNPQDFRLPRGPRHAFV